MKVLIIGHACGPGLGSEPGNTWNWAWNLAQTEEVWVITHPEYKARVDRFLAEHPNENLHFNWVTTHSRLDTWVPGKEQEKGIRLHYILWLREAYRRAAKLHEEVQYDVAHHVSWSTISVSPAFWRMPTPCIWGPVGGGQVIPSQFLCLIRNNRFKERLRTMYVRLLPFSPLLRKSVRSAALILTSNYETRDLIRRAGAKRIRLFLDCGVAGDVEAAPRTPAKDASPAGGGSPFTLLWAGRIEAQKGLLLALYALARDENPAVRMVVAGTGSADQEMKALTKSLGLENRVDFLGRVPHDEMPALFQRCDAFFFTGLRDTFGTVVLEAMSYGLPVVTVNHQGVGAFVPEDASIKVPVSSLEETKKDLALAIQALASEPDYRAEMSKGALRSAEAQRWPNRVAVMKTIYEEVIRSWRSGRGTDARRARSRENSESLEVTSPGVK
jgi:glycosyltransferase involved in cell wall biosynthesis